MNKTAWIFPGQGAQYPGMGKDLFEHSSTAREVFERADETLGYSLKKVLFEGSAQELAMTEITQPAILTVSVALMEMLKKQGFSPALTAGLSLGEYTAHVCAGSLDFEDALGLVQKRGRFMQEAVPPGAGAMAAILGLSAEKIESLAELCKPDGFVALCNYNCPGQIVIGGQTQAVKRAMELAKEEGAKKVALLPVSAPFHTPMLEPAACALQKELEKIAWKPMKIPVISNVHAKSTAPGEIIDVLTRQVVSPVLFAQCIQTIEKEGTKTCVEIGPGKTLTGFVKKTAPSMRTFHIQDQAGFEALCQALIA